MTKDRKKRYTVYNNRTDFPVIVSGTAEECARAMGIKFSSFYSAHSKNRKGIHNKWTFIVDEEEDA